MPRLSLALMLCLPVATAFAQPEPQPTFEVATIKPSDPTARHVMTGVSPTPDGMEANMATVATLLRVAYGYQNFPLESQITNLPAWTKSQQFDIRAKLSDSDRESLHKLSSADQFLFVDRALQSLLAERFHLQFHRDVKQFPAYYLIPVKGGPRIKPTPDDDPTLIKGPDGKPIHGIAMFKHKGETSIQQDTMAEFASVLATSAAGAGRPVINKTDLAGVYTFTLHISLAANPTAQPDTDSLSLFTALQEDLGLKLQPSTATLPILIIDRLDRPSDN